MISALILAAAYLTGAVGIWRMGPLAELTGGGWREISVTYRVIACAIWPLTLLMMWEV